MKILTAQTWVGLVAALAIGAIAVMSFHVAAAGTTVVSGNTSEGENLPGWYFSRDLTSYTPYEFVEGTSTAGAGSLYAGPITNTNSGNFDFSIPDNDSNRDKFVAEYFPETLPVALFEGFSYDVMMGSGGGDSQTDMFYLNIYANIDDSDNFYDCRYDYVFENVSTTQFNKHVVAAASSPTRVQKRGDRIRSCPTILSAMPEGSHIRVIAINMGDTSDADTNLDGYFDNVELLVNGDATYFDFESGPQTKADCQRRGWKDYGFKNQGQCIQSVK